MKEEIRQMTEKAQTFKTLTENYLAALEASPLIDPEILSQLARISALTRAEVDGWLIHHFHTTGESE